MPKYHYEAAHSPPDCFLHEPRLRFLIQPRSRYEFRPTHRALRSSGPAAPLCNAIFVETVFVHSAQGAKEGRKLISSFRFEAYTAIVLRLGLLSLGLLSLGLLSRGLLSVELSRLLDVGLSRLLEIGIGGH